MVGKNINYVQYYITVIRDVADIKFYQVTGRVIQNQIITN